LQCRHLLSSLVALVLEDQGERLLGEVATSNKPLDSPMSSRGRFERIRSPGEETPEDDVGEVALERPPCLARGLAFVPLAGQENLGLR